MKDQPRLQNKSSSQKQQKDIRILPQLTNKEVHV